MVKIGGEPMLYHIMGIYANCGFNDFIIAGGYKREVIADWLSTAYLPWKVQLVDTGLETQTAKRVELLRPLLTERFMLTYGDGVANVDLRALLDFHDNGPASLCTVTAVHPPPRWGQIVLDTEYVLDFTEKPPESAWINGGFFVVEPQALDYIEGDEDWAGAVLPRLPRAHALTAYRHPGFWQCVDTMRDVEYLNRLAEGVAPWI